jgi:hypothetical protein
MLLAVMPGVVNPSRPLSLLFFALCGVLPCHSQSMPVSNQPISNQWSLERTLQAQTFAAERLWLWQKRLNLQDWSISVVVSRASELKPKTLGNVHWDLEKRTAVIRVLDPADYRLAPNLILHDIELTVVHELIHLEMAPTLADLHRTDANRVQEEKAVNRMADALLLLDRSK